MKIKNLIYIFVGLLTSSTLVIGGSFSPIAGLLITNSVQAQVPGIGQDPHHPSAQATPPRRGMMTQGVDRHFIEMMIPHHEDAVEMAELALSRAKHPEIKKLAQAIIKEQNREIEQMQTWYKKWYGTEVPAASMPGMGMMERGQGMRGMSMHPNMIGMEMHLETLKNASDFDREFIIQMIPHHRMAVMMSNMALNSATHPEIRNLMQSMIKSQTAEIEQMWQWYQAWYR